MKKLKEFLVDVGSKKFLAVLVATFFVFNVASPIFALDGQTSQEINNKEELHQTGSVGDNVNTDGIDANKVATQDGSVEVSTDKVYVPKNIIKDNNGKYYAVVNFEGQGDFAVELNDKMGKGFALNNIKKEISFNSNNLSATEGYGLNVGNMTLRVISNSYVVTPSEYKNSGNVSWNKTEQFDSANVVAIQQNSPDSPTNDNPTNDNPTIDTPTNDNPTNDNPTIDTPTNDNPTIDTPTNDNPTPASVVKDNTANVSAATDVINATTSIMSALFDNLASMGTDSENILTQVDVFRGSVATFTSIITGLVSNIINNEDGFAGVADAVKTTFDDAFAAFTDKATELLGKATDLVNDFFSKHITVEGIGKFVRVDTKQDDNGNPAYYALFDDGTQQFYIKVDKDLENEEGKTGTIKFNSKYAKITGKFNGVNVVSSKDADIEGLKGKETEVKDDEPKTDDSKIDDSKTDDSKIDDSKTDDPKTDDQISEVVVKFAAAEVPVESIGSEEGTFYAVVKDENGYGALVDLTEEQYNELKEGGSIEFNSNEVKGKKDGEGNIIIANDNIKNVKSNTLEITGDSTFVKTIKTTDADGNATYYAVFKNGNNQFAVKMNSNFEVDENAEVTIEIKEQKLKIIDKVEGVPVVDATPIDIKVKGKVAEPAKTGKFEYDKKTKIYTFYDENGKTLGTINVKNLTQTQITTIKNIFNNNGKNKTAFEKAKVRANYYELIKKYSKKLTTAQMNKVKDAFNKNGKDKQALEKATNLAKSYVPIKVEYTAKKVANVLQDSKGKVLKTKSVTTKITKDWKENNKTHNTTYESKWTNKKNGTTKIKSTWTHTSKDSKGNKTTTAVKNNYNLSKVKTTKNTTNTKVTERKITGTKTTYKNGKKTKTEKVLSGSTRKVTTNKKTGTKTVKTTLKLKDTKTGKTRTITTTKTVNKKGQTTSIKRNDSSSKTKTEKKINPKTGKVDVKVINKKTNKVTKKYVETPKKTTAKKETKKSSSSSSKKSTGAKKASNNKNKKKK